MGQTKRIIEFEEDNQKIWSAYINSKKREWANKEVDRVIKKNNDEKK